MNKEKYGEQTFFSSLVHLTYDLAALSIECDGFLTSCCDNCCVGVLRMEVMMGAVTGTLTGSAGLIGLIVFFMINSSVSPANL